MQKPAEGLGCPGPSPSSWYFVQLEAHVTRLAPQEILEKIVPLSHLHTSALERAECLKTSELLHKVKLSAGEESEQRTQIK